jgi:hypothetical protein
MAAVNDDHAQERADRLIAEAKDLSSAGDAVAAARRYVDAATTFAPYASFALAAGDLLYEDDRFDDAAAAYRVVVEAVPEHEQAWHGLGRSLVAAGEVDEGRAALVRSQAVAAGVAYGDVSAAIEAYFATDDRLERGRIVESVIRSDDERVPWLLHQHVERAAILGTAIGDLDHWRPLAIALVRLGVSPHLDWYTDGPAPSREWIVEDIEKYLAANPEPVTDLWPVAYGPGDAIPRQRWKRPGRRRWFRRRHSGSR